MRHLAHSIYSCLVKLHLAHNIRLFNQVFQHLPLATFTVDVQQADLRA